MINKYTNNSLLNKKWKIKNFNERDTLMISQKYEVSPILAKLLSLRFDNEVDIKNFLNFDFHNNIPDPFTLKDMDKTVQRTIKAIIEKQNIGIIADYDVDGSTSASILFKFLKYCGCKVNIKIPNRLFEGYGPNKRIMNEFYTEKTDLIFSLDCGTNSFGIIDHDDFKKIDIVVIDHHISENYFPDIFSIINPNRYDEKGNLKNLAAVGVTFLFILALRKKLRVKDFFNKTNIKEPNLLSYLDLVALGTVCDIVKLQEYNRIFVTKGLEIIRKRTNKGICKLIDNAKINRTPKSSDLSYIIGPQLNAASRIEGSSLATDILISEDIFQIETISKKLFLLNEKRKLIEKEIFIQAMNQANKQTDKKVILVSGFGWHLGVLGIIASRLTKYFNKPSIVISFDQNIGTGSARSINNIDLGNLILSAKNEGLLISGGGHKMAAGLKIKNENLKKFNDFILKNIEKFGDSFFQNVETYDLRISINEVNKDLLQIIEDFEPYGKGNEEIKFIIYGIKINHFKIIKNKHIMVFFNNDSSKKIQGFCFNSVDTQLGENIMKNKTAKFEFGCTIEKDYFNNNNEPKIIINDGLIVD